MTNLETGSAWCAPSFELYDLQPTPWDVLHSLQVAKGGIRFTFDPNAVSTTPDAPQYPNDPHNLHPHNPYYRPEDFGLQLVGDVNFDLGYGYDMTAVWVDAAGQLWHADSSGCSCSAPFGEYTDPDSESAHRWHPVTLAKLGRHLQTRNQEGAVPRDGEIVDLLARADRMSRTVCTAPASRRPNNTITWRGCISDGPSTVDRGNMVRPLFLQYSWTNFPCLVCMIPLGDGPVTTVTIGIDPDQQEPVRQGASHGTAVAVLIHDRCAFPAESG